MAEENLRSRHAFGSSANVGQAIAGGKIDAYDILFLDGDTSPKVGWVDKDGNVRVVENECVITVEGDSLPETGEVGKVYIYNGDFYYWNGTEFDTPTCEGVTEDVVNAKVVEAVDTATQYADEKVEDVIGEVERSYEKISYEIVSKPEGTLVDYRDKEIRVMCPANTKWTKQSVGGTGNANMYYMGFRAYAPEGAVSFKEGDRGVIIDEMFTFDSEFAGTDEFGRNYSICWLALASYDEATDTWTYFGKNSSTEKYIGWTYVVEWYDAKGVVIASDCIRINLSNEECHYQIEPYYVSNVIGNVDDKVEEAVTSANTYTDEQIAAIVDAMAIVEF